MNFGSMKENVDHLVNSTEALKRNFEILNTRTLEKADRAFYEEACDFWAESVSFWAWALKRDSNA